MVGKVRIPKFVGPVKLSKKVRKKAKKAIKKAANPFVRDFATVAMAAASRGRRSAPGRDSESEREDHSMCGTRIDVDAAKVAEVFRTAAMDGLRRFMEGLEEGFREARAEEEAGKARSAEKPKAPAKPRAAAKPKRPAKPRKPSPSGPPPGAAPA